MTHGSRWRVTPQHCGEITLSSSYRNNANPWEAVRASTELANRHEKKSYARRDGTDMRGIRNLVKFKNGPKFEGFS